MSTLQTEFNIKHISIWKPTFNKKSENQKQIGKKKQRKMKNSIHIELRK